MGNAQSVTMSLHFILKASAMSEIVYKTTPFHPDAARGTLCNAMQ